MEEFDQFGIVHLRQDLFAVVLVHQQTWHLHQGLAGVDQHEQAHEGNVRESRGFRQRLRPGAPKCLDDHVGDGIRRRVRAQHVEGNHEVGPSRVEVDQASIC